MSELDSFRTAAVLAAVLALSVTGVTQGVGGLVSPAAAQESDTSTRAALSDAVDSIKDADGDGRIADDAAGLWWETTKAGLSRIGHDWGQTLGFSEPEQSASREAAEVQSYLNNNSAAYENHTWMRNAVNISSSEDTIRVTWVIGDEKATRYLLGNATGDGTVEDIRMVRFTDRSVDESVALCGLAAEESAEELRDYTERFAVPDKAPTQKYLAHVTGRYRPDVSTTLVPDRDGCEVPA